MADWDRLARRLADQATPPVIRAYHGSPYDFDRFDASKIGTGEGAQAYGHGLYFAGNEAVAQSYRRSLAGAPEPMDLAIDGDPVFRKSWPMLPPHHKDGTNYLMSRLRNYSDEYAPEALGEMRQDLPRLIEHYITNPEDNPFSQASRLSELRGAMDLLDNHKVTVLPSRNPGRSYEVELGVPESSMLDWDQPVEAQADSVRSAVTRLLGDDQVSGQYAYRELEQNMGSPRSASETLKAVGVPGIRYFDGGSRRFGEGTRNYVMFPGTEDSIRILRKYGLLGPAAAGVMQQDDSP